MTTDNKPAYRWSLRRMLAALSFAFLALLLFGGTYVWFNVKSFSVQIINKLLADYDTQVTAVSLNHIQRDELSLNHITLNVDDSHIILNDVTVQLDAPIFNNVSLSDWLTGGLFPLSAARLGISTDTIKQIAIGTIDVNLGASLFTGSGKAIDSQGPSVGLNLSQLPQISIGRTALHLPHTLTSTPQRDTATSNSDIPQLVNTQDSKADTRTPLLILDKLVLDDNGHFATSLSQVNAHAGNHLDNHLSNHTSKAQSDNNAIALVSLDAQLDSRYWQVSSKIALAPLIEFLRGAAQDLTQLASTSQPSSIISSSDPVSKPAKSLAMSLATQQTTSFNNATQLSPNAQYFVEVMNKFDALLLLLDGQLESSLALNLQSGQLTSVHSWNDAALTLKQFDDLGIILQSRQAQSASPSSTMAGNIGPDAEPTTEHIAAPIPKLTTTAQAAQKSPSLTIAISGDLARQRLIVTPFSVRLSPTQSQLAALLRLIDDESLQQTLADKIALLSQKSAVQTDEAVTQNATAARSERTSAPSTPNEASLQLELNLASDLSVPLSLDDLFVQPHDAMPNIAPWLTIPSILFTLDIGDSRSQLALSDMTVTGDKMTGDKMSGVEIGLNLRHNLVLNSLTPNNLISPRY